MTSLKKAPHSALREPSWCDWQGTEMNEPENDVGQARSCQVALEVLGFGGARLRDVQRPMQSLPGSGGKVRTGRAARRRGKASCV